MCPMAVPKVILNISYPSHDLVPFGRIQPCDRLPSIALRTATILPQLLKGLLGFFSSLLLKLINCQQPRCGSMYPDT